MATSDSISLVAVVVGVLWTAAYVLIIRQGFLDKTYGMPFISICCNTAWEFIYAFIFPQAAPQLYISVLWFVLDGIMLYQFIHYGRPQIQEPLFKRFFVPLVLLVLCMSFAGILTGYYEFNDGTGRYTSFPINLMMSALFITMLARRNNVSGQSLYAAIFKMLATGIASTSVYVLAPNTPFLWFCYVSVFVLDIIYIVALYAKCRELAINPWTRL